MSVLLLHYTRHFWSCGVLAALICRCSHASRGADAGVAASAAAASLIRQRRPCTPRQAAPACRQPVSGRFLVSFRVQMRRCRELFGLARGHMRCPRARGARCARLLAPRSAHIPDHTSRDRRAAPCRPVAACTAAAAVTLACLPMADAVRGSLLIDRTGSRCRQAGRRVLSLWHTLRNECSPAAWVHRQSSCAKRRAAVRTSRAAAGGTAAVCVHIVLRACQRAGERRAGEQCGGVAGQVKVQVIDFSGLLGSAAAHAQDVCQPGAAAPQGAGLRPLASFR